MTPTATRASYRAQAHRNSGLALGVIPVLLVLALVVIVAMAVRDGLDTIGRSFETTTTTAPCIPAGSYAPGPRCP